MGRFIFLMAYIAVQVWLLFYIGIGYAVLLGYLFLILVMALPVKASWLDSKFGKLVYGTIARLDIEVFIRSLSKSRSYRVCLIITSLILLAVVILMITQLNYKFIEII